MYQIPVHVRWADQQLFEHSTPRLEESICLSIAGSVDILMAGSDPKNNEVNSRWGA